MPYEEQVKFKTDFIRCEFEPFYSGEFEFFASQSAAYRTRAEFGVWRDGEELRYTMHGASIPLAHEINSAPNSLSFKI